MEPEDAHELAEDVDLITREEWGAVEPRDAKIIKLPAFHVIFTYCTDAELRKWPLCKTQEECSKTMQDMQKYYMEEENIRDIPYNFVVGGDGRMYEGRGWYLRPAKNKNWTCIYGTSIEIAYMGDHHAKRPHKKMWRAAWDFIVFAVMNNLLARDYEFIENYDQERLDAIQRTKPWYKQYYHYMGV
uniref:Peptidoglycan recognition protein 9 n=1 Tax=Nephotettix cincticeps TaxID=94400 RepID=A0A5H2WZY5_NEPCI|nr:peptidoglycan recognition protein 9 [Nephotettix cincticeps]